MDPTQGNAFVEDHDDPEDLEQKQHVNIDNEDQDQNNSNEEQNRHENIDQQPNENAYNQQNALKLQINELQKICNSLTNTNRKLMFKLNQLEEQRDERESNRKEEIFVDQYSELNGDFTQVQTVIHQYKKSLDEFQKNVLADMKIKQQKIGKMKIEINGLLDQNVMLQAEKEDLIKVSKQLETRNQGLILEIENLEKENSKLQQQLSRASPRYPHQEFRYNNYSQSNEEELPNQIQNQYEILINKLVKQLEYERNVRKKMNEEIKRMSQELMDSEREIMEKNKKLYEFEMKLLKSNKVTIDTSPNYSKLKTDDLKIQKNLRQDKSSPRSNRRSVEKDYPKPNFKSFVLLQLINGELGEEIFDLERKIIGIKIIQFYEQKLQSQDYSNLMPENLLIGNFNHKKPQLLSIRKVGSNAYEGGQKSQETLVQNLAFILDNLFAQSQGIEDFNQILELTGNLLQKRAYNNRESVQIMKELLTI